MDFTLGEELEAVRDLAREIFTDHATPGRLKETERSDSRLDAALWGDLAAAGLLGIVLPEEHGGAGLGFDALAVLLEEQGRLVAPVPLWSATVAALAIAAYGSPAQRSAHLPGAGAGTARTALALEEFGPAGPLEPDTTAVRDGDRWRISGIKAVVPAPSGAGQVLLTATTDTGPGLFLLPADAAGRAWEYAETTSLDRAGHLRLDGAPAQAVGSPGDGAVEWTVERALVALAAVQAGVARGALDLAAQHLGTRHQFGRPLATFQAVQHQLADCLIDIDAMRVTLWQAACALRDGESASREVLVAAWWAKEAGLDVVHRVQHVHGGIGVDTDYPVHRHFLWGKQISTTLGGAADGLARLGKLLTATAPQGVAS